MAQHDHKNTRRGKAIFQGKYFATGRSAFKIDMLLALGKIAAVRGCGRKNVKVFGGQPPCASIYRREKTVPLAKRYGHLWASFSFCGTFRKQIGLPPLFLAQIHA